MKNKLLIIVLLIGIKAQAQTKALFDSTAKPQLISKEFTFTEGPSVDSKGNIFFTDQPNDKIWKYDTDGKFSVFLDKTHRSNGMYFDKKGNLITCADETGQLLSIDKNGKITVLAQDFSGHQLNGPNDVWVNRATGGIYFTDPYYQRDYWTRKKSDQDGQKVYYMAKGGKPVIVEDKMKTPNGIVGTADNKTLFIADIGDNKTFKYTMEADGSLTNKQQVLNMGSDGMTIDELGNFYLCNRGGVTIFSPTGVKITRLDIPEPWVANVCFGGKDRKLLFITAQKAIYTMHMNVKGIE